MNDDQIVDLFFLRSENAIAEGQKKFGNYLTAIAKNILTTKEDAEECVEDTWLRAWNSIPPARPVRLAVFLGRITRNLAIDRYREYGAKKRGSRLKICLDELSECTAGLDMFWDDIQLKDLIDRFLYGLGAEARRIFMLRYWYMYSAKEIAGACSMTEGAVKMSLSRTRNALKNYLENEEIAL